MADSPDDWRPGEPLRVRGVRWTLHERIRFADCDSLRLERAGAIGASCTLLLPFDRPVRRRTSRGLVVVRPRRWLHHIRRAGALGHTLGGLNAAAGDHFDLLPYQLEPALSMLRHGASRVLLADAVGLGKTVQAGLVLKELAAHGTFRGLIIAPAGLLPQWSAELASRFRLEAATADAAWLARAGRDLPPGMNPWVLPGLYLTSFDFLKRPEVVLALDDASWDLLVVDEAHAASPGTARRAAVQAAAVRATRVMLLSATPHTGNSEHFAALCRIGSPDVPAASPDGRLVVFQRSRDHVGSGTRRRTVLLPVPATGHERRMHRLLEDYTARVWRAAGDGVDPRARLAAVVLRKRALSSAASLAASARRRLALLDAGTPADHPSQADLPLDPDADGITSADAAPDGVLAVPGLVSGTRERRWLSALVASAETSSGGESKTRVLLRLLRRIRRPAIVFTEYRDTLERLGRLAAADGHRVVTLHGGLSRAERADALRAFAEGGCVLFATDAASEGLNLQPRCHVVVHYELPWSPARLEQRTGRVDRIGQSRRVHEILLVSDDAAERLVLAPLARRIRSGRGVAPFLSRLGDAMEESRVATAIMEGRLVPPTGDAGDGRLPDDCVPAPDTLRAEAEEEACRLRQRRAWAASFAENQAPGAPLLSWIARRRSTLPSGAIYVFSICLVAGDGTVLERHIECVTSPGALGSRRGSAAEMRRTVGAYLAAHGAALAASALEHAAARLDGARARHLQAAERLEARERVLADACPVASTLLQPGLFDSRAMHLDAVRRQRAAARRDASLERLRQLEQARQVTTTCDLEGVLLSDGPRR